MTSLEAVRAGSKPDSNPSKAAMPMASSANLKVTTAMLTLTRSRTAKFTASVPKYHENPADAADDRQQQAFQNDELEHETGFRTNRADHAEFAGALVDAHHHGVGDRQAADDQ